MDFGNSGTIIVGGLAALFTFLPRVSMNPSDQADPTNPFAESFTITNTGYIPLHHVDARIVVGQVAAEPLPFNPPKTFTLGSGGIVRPEWLDHTVATDERFAVSTEGIFGMGGNAKLSGADVARKDGESYTLTQLRDAADRSTASSTLCTSTADSRSACSGSLCASAPRKSPSVAMKVCS